MHLKYTGIVVANADRKTLCTYICVIHGNIHTLRGTLDRTEIEWFCKNKNEVLEKNVQKIIGTQKPCSYRCRYLRCFSLHVLEYLIRNIVKGDVSYCSLPNLLILGPNKIRTALWTCSNVASWSACPSIFCVEGQWFCWQRRWRWSYQFGWERDVEAIPFWWVFGTKESFIYP